MAGGSMKYKKKAPPAAAPPSLDAEGVTIETHSHLFWPEKLPLPRQWRRHYPPCRLCRRMLTVARVQAVVLLKTSEAKAGRVAHMLCRACGGQFTLEVAP